MSVSKIDQDVLLENRPPLATTLSMGKTKAIELPGDREIQSLKKILTLGGVAAAALVAIAILSVRDNTKSVFDGMEEELTTGTVIKTPDISDITGNTDPIHNPQNAYLYGMLGADIDGGSVGERPISDGIIGGETFQTWEEQMGLAGNNLPYEPPVE